MPDVSREERILGCLLAGALGDAIGAAFEGQPAGQEFRLPSALRVTDDTQLTLATCESLIQHGSVDAQSIANRFVTWFRARRITGIGSSTLKALIELDAGGHWAFVGATGEHSAGSGAAMRIAPLAFFLDPDDAGQRQTIRDVCRITHRNEEAYVGALAILRTIRHVAAGSALQGDSLSDLAERLPDSRVRDRMLEISAQLPTIPEYAARYGTSGFVVDAVPLAILAAGNATDLLVMIAEITRCGGDTDTICSMAAQIVGASKGPCTVPAEIPDRIDVADLIRDLAARLSVLETGVTT